MMMKKRNFTKDAKSKELALAMNALANDKTYVPQEIKDLLFNLKKEKSGNIDFIPNLT